jgi:hypothetical protein
MKCRVALPRAAPSFRRAARFWRDKHDFAINDRPGHSTSTAVDYRILAWTIVAGGLLPIATYAVAVSPAPDPDAIIAMIVQP